MEVSIYGRRFTVAPEPADFWGWVEKGNYDGEWAILEKFLRPEHHFLDLGAWVGSHSLFASTIAKRVTAVEPDPVAVAILEANTKGLPISVGIGAIGGHNGTVTLGSGFLGASTTRANPEAGGGIGPWAEGHTFETPCCTLRKFVEEIIVPRPVGPLFIKMDIEGGEELVLQDVALFAEHKPTIYLETHSFWWTDPRKGWATVRSVAALYKRVLNLQMIPADLDSEPRGLILTDEE